MLGSSVFDPAEDVSIGAAFSVGGTQDLKFEYRDAGTGNVFEGNVTYVTGGGLNCDLDADGDGDLLDIDLLYAGNPGEAGVSTWLSEASSPANPYKTAAGGTVDDVYVLGDINLDGDVNSTDLGSLLNNFNSATGVGWGGGDLNADRNVNSTDLGSLLNNFNFTSAAAAAVPEPGSLVMLWLGIAGLVAGNFRRERTRS